MSEGRVSILKATTQVSETLTDFNRLVNRVLLIFVRKVLGKWRDEKPYFWCIDHG